MGNEISSESDANTIPKRLQFFAQTRPDRELFVFYNKSGDKRDPYTTQQVLQLAGKFAHRLRQHGFKKGDVIVNTLPNSPERLITDLGIILAGCITMNGQLLLSDGSDFFGSAKVSKCKCIIMHPDDDTPAWKLFKTTITGDTSTFLTDISCSQTPDLTSAILVSRLAIGEKKPLLEDLKTSVEETFCETSEPGDTFVIFTTSGSTGYSKLVPRSHEEIIPMFHLWMRQIEAMRSRGSLRSCPFYSDRPLGWAGGYPYGALVFGNKQVLIDTLASHGSREESAAWDIMRHEQCKIGALLPPDLSSILTQVSSLGGTDYKLQILMIGGQPLTKEFVRRIYAVTEEVLVYYAATEAVPVSMTILKDENGVQDYLCGRAFIDGSVRIMNQHGQPCKPLETGTIQVRGPQIFKGYFSRLENPDPQTAKAFKSDGWLDMGDLGYTDSDGNIYVLGRQKDTIMYGPVVLYPGWLERKIEEHPDVELALIVPVSDPVLFHNICACVKPTPGSDLTEDKIKTHCESIFISDLSSERTPMPKFFFILQELPKTYTGKINKQKVKEMAEEMFGYKLKEKRLPTV